jgi:hypothetical protein
LHVYFHSIFQELEQQRDRVLDSVKNLSSEKFNYVPASGKWSIGQILTHLLTAEQLSLGYMKKKVLGIDQAGTSGISSALRLELLKVSQRIPALKFKAPAIVVRSTPQAFSQEEISKRWKAHHEDLKSLLEKIEGNNVKKLLYKHPFAGRFDARQAMIFSREHVNHHWPQVKRLLN